MAKSFDVSTSIYPNTFAIVDDDDYDAIVVGKKWFAYQSGCSPKTIYVAAKINGKRVILHRLLAGAANRSEIVDHINGNGLDNRRLNLRICAQRENLRNRGINRNNTSGYKGVSWEKHTKKWVAKIGVDGKEIRLGKFDNKQDAAIAYKIAAIRFHGQFAKFTNV